MATLAPYMLFGQTPMYNPSANYFCGLVGHDIDGDGSGGNLEKDPDFQPTTTLKHFDGTYLNSRTEIFGAIPGKFIDETPGIVMGCRMRATHVLKRIWTDMVAGDRGPDEKWGEFSIASASFFDVDPNPVTGGTRQPIIFVEIWVGQTVEVDGIAYPLQPSL